MSDKWIEVEGVDLAEAITTACSQLGLPREELDYDFDLDHFKGGASTARIFAGRRDPRAAQLGGKIEERVKGLLEARNLDARVSVRVTLFAVQIELRVPPLAMADEEVRSFVATLERDLAEYLEGRPLRVSLRGLGAGSRSEENHHRQRRGRHEDRGRLAGRRRSSGPDDRSDRDESLRRAARRAVQRVLRGDGPVALEDLNSYERRLVHLTVRESDGVVSHSVGDGLHKDVLIERSSPGDSGD